MSDLPPPRDEEAQAFVADGLTITECRPVTLASAPTVEIPLIVVDADRRQDLMDLGRVFVQEQPGGGEVHTSWDLLVLATSDDEPSGDHPHGYVSLTIAIEKPVTSSLKILFPIPQWIEELAVIESAPKLAIALGPPDARGNWEPFRTIV